MTRPRQVADRGRAEERQHVVLAQRVEGDAFDHHHLGVTDVEDGAVDQSIRIDAVAAGQLEPHPMHTLRGAKEAFTIRVLADLRQDLADRALDAARGTCDTRPSGSAGRPVGVRLGRIVVAALDLLDDAADVRVQIEPVFFGGMVGGHG